MNKPDSDPILITGAGRGVGAHLAHRLLAAGHPVLAHYRSETDALRALREQGARTLAAELTDSAELQALTETIQREYQGLRAIIHNASAFEPTAADPDAAVAQFQTFFDVHMRAPYWLNRALAPLLGVAGAPADIIHITDIYANNPAPEYDIYCASKAGLQNLALSFAKTLAPAIKVNVIQPGPIDFDAGQSEQTQANILARTPLGRTGGPEAVYQAVRAVLDNDYMTGAVIPVDGGRRLG